MNHDITSKGWIFWACLGILLLLVPIPVNSIPDGHDQDYYNFDGSKQADYYFNEGAGTSTHDDSGNGNTMTLTGTGWTTGKDGTSAISFSQGSYTTLPNNANLNLEELDEWNICMNIKFLGLMSYQQTDLFQKCDGNGNGISAKIISDIIILYLNPNTQNSFTLTDPEPADIYDESWHYLCCVA